MAALALLSPLSKPMFISQPILRYLSFQEVVNTLFRQVACEVRYLIQYVFWKGIAKVLPLDVAAEYLNSEQDDILPYELMMGCSSRIHLPNNTGEYGEKRGAMQSLQKLFNGNILK